MGHRDNIMSEWHRHGAREAWLTARLICNGDVQAAVVLIAELDAPEHVRRGILSYSSAEPDLDVTPLSVGFDLRVQGTLVAVPESTRWVRYDLDGEVREVIGTREQVIAALTAAGYEVARGGDSARAAFAARFERLSDAAEFEGRVLAIGSEFLPACALAVRDGGAATDEYWAWLIAQHEAVEAES